MSEANEFSKRLFARFVAVRLRAWRLERDEQRRSGLERVHDTPIGAESDTVRNHANANIPLKEASPDRAPCAFEEPSSSG
jgi:hypothetical protein